MNPYQPQVGDYVQVITADPQVSNFGRVEELDADGFVWVKMNTSHMRMRCTKSELKRVAGL